MERQKLLFSLEHLFDINPLKSYELLFNNLDTSSLDPKPRPQGGRSPYHPASLLRALIYKNLRGLNSLSDLADDILNNPSVALKCGFDILRLLPSVERFSKFISDTPNQLLQDIRIDLILKLIKAGQVRGRYLSLDSCPVPACVKENNLRTNTRDRFSKDKLIKGDPDAGLGIIVHYPTNDKKRIQYFWGYRNHVVSDAETELPIWEATKPANVFESNLFIPMFKDIQKIFSFDIAGVLGDSAFDSEAILNFIFKELKANPYIARNPRRKTNLEYSVSNKGARICIAGFEMLYWGRFEDRGKLRLKFVCPITHSKAFRKNNPSCPMWHPKFLNGKGCTAYLRADENIRERINYGSEDFKKIYNLRTGSERIFSRLLSVCMQRPSIKGLQSTINYCTIAHITVLLVALTAVTTGNKDKIRFIKTLLPNL
ncbi:MAG: transposase [Candidatus Omnitrophica bacterium]|nr:transposase [Candidatus Omnitrophota bacterium]